MADTAKPLEKKPEEKQEKDAETKKGDVKTAEELVYIKIFL